jgi:hypothetical protein
VGEEEYGAKTLAVGDPFASWRCCIASDSALARHKTWRAMLGSIGVLNRPQYHLYLDQHRYGHSPHHSPSSFFLELAM